MYTITINEVEEGEVRAFAVMVGCKSYTYLTALGMLSDVGAYVQMGEDKRGAAESAIMRARELGRGYKFHEEDDRPVAVPTSLQGEETPAPTEAQCAQGVIEAKVDPGNF